MGWMYNDHITVKNNEIEAYLKRSLEGEDKTHRHTFVDFSLVKSVAYIAINRLDKETQKSEIFCEVVLIDRKEGFGYKDMSEHMMPYYFDCPLRILKKLTPTTHKSCLEWRQNCLKEHKRLKDEKNKMKAVRDMLAPDLVVKLHDNFIPEEVSFISWLPGNRAFYGRDLKTLTPYKIKLIHIDCDHMLMKKLSAAS